MAILKVARMGHPVLRTLADPIPPDQISSPAVQQLIEDMLDTCEEYEGVGLAAPQVHFSVQLVILEVDDTGPTVWINPQLTPLTDELIYTFEGCLSVPEMRGMVGRPASVEVHALSRDGEPVHMELHGFPAVVAQHECDHLSGSLYVDKIVPKTLTFLEEHRRFANWEAEDAEEAEEEAAEAAEEEHEAEMDLDESEIESESESFLVEGDDAEEDAAEEDEKTRKGNEAEKSAPINVSSLTDIIDRTEQDA